MGGSMIASSKHRGRSRNLRDYNFNLKHKAATERWGKDMRALGMAPGFENAKSIHHAVLPPGHRTKTSPNSATKWGPHV